MLTPDKYTLKPSLSESFDGIIWKVEIDEVEHIIAVETRNIYRRTTSYSAFNYKSGKTLFKEITVDDSWFWSLDRVYKGMVFLHSYVHQGSPEHAGIIAFDKLGNIAWQHFNKALMEITAAGLIAYNPKIQPKLLELLSALDGSVLRNNLDKFEPIAREIIVPDVITDVNELKHLLPENPAGPVFYKKHNRRDLLVFHVQTGSVYMQQLRIFEHGNLILEDNLATNIQKLNPEAFFIVRNHMFCIRNNKQELVSYLV